MKKGKNSPKIMKEVHAIRHRAHKIRTHRHFGKAFLFVIGFAAVGVTLLLISRASTPTADIETESASITGCASVVTDSSASSGQAISFGCPAAVFPVHPGVVYSQADIDAWSTSSPEYTRLANDNYGKTSYAVISFGDSVINGPSASATSELNAGLKDMSGAAKAQAVLWAAAKGSARDPVRKAKVVAYLDAFKNVRDFEWDSGEQYRLVAGWGCTNLAQAAEIVDYQDAGFKTFLRKCYDEMDWTANPNWFASFADSKLAIAAYLGDANLWKDAKDYFYERIAQNIYDSAYDSGKVKYLHKADTKIDVWKTNADGSYVYETNADGSFKVDANGNKIKIKIDTLVPYRLHATPGTIVLPTPVDTNPNLGSTRQNWGGPYDPAGKGQILDDYTINTAYGPAVDGMNAERLRDLGHVNMGLGAFMHGIRTLKAQGEESTPQYNEAYNRLLAAYSYQSQRVLTYAQTGVFPSPAPTQGDGGGSRFQGYYGAKKLFGAQTPASVISMLARSEVTGYDAGGYNHLVAEAFADQ